MSLRGWIWNVDIEYCILRSGKTRNELSDSGLSTCGRVKQDGLAKSATEFSEDALQRAGRA